MVQLRNFQPADALLLKDLVYPDISTEEIQEMISQWERKEYSGRYFEMFGVFRDNQLVGTVSLFAHSTHSISCGPEILPQYRKQGFGRAAVLAAMEIAKSKGYQIAFSQIRTDNASSIALHRSLGFETDGYVFKNQKDKDVLIYLKSLVS